MMKRKELHALQDKLLKAREDGRTFAQLAEDAGRDEENVRFLVQAARSRRAMRKKIKRDKAREKHQALREEDENYRKEYAALAARERRRSNETPEQRADRLTRGFLTRAGRCFTGHPFACQVYLKEQGLSAAQAAA